MIEQEIDLVISKFLVRFNEMCQNENRAFLIREKTVNYESGSKTKIIKVTYRIKKQPNEWLIEAVDNGFWIFKKRFPLLRINKNNSEFSFSGMFTSSFRNFPQEELEEKLNQYLSICKSQTNNVFTKC
jgi:hypothetical protein